MANVQSEKDVGVIFDLNMSFREDINSHTTKANNIMGIIRRRENIHLPWYLIIQIAI